MEKQKQGVLIAHVLFFILLMANTLITALISSVMEKSSLKMSNDLSLNQTTLRSNNENTPHRDVFTSHSTHSFYLTSMGDGVNGQTPPLSGSGGGVVAGPGGLGKH